MSLLTVQGHSRLDYPGQQQNRSYRVVVLPAILLLSFAPNSGWADLTYSITAPVAVGTNRTQDLIVTTSTDWLSAELLLNLTSGSIYQHPFGGTTRPNPLLIDTNPELAFDTFVWNGVSFTTPIDIAPVGIAGGAVDLGGNSMSTFNTSVLDVTWYTTATTDIGTLALARVTLSNMATGTWRIRLSNDGGDLIVTPSQPVIDGQLVVPEPSSVALVAAASLIIVIRRWSSAAINALSDKIIAVVRASI